MIKPGNGQLVDTANVVFFPKLRCSSTGRVCLGNYYSVNQGYYLKFDVEMRRYIDHCSDLNLRLRYIGSMVSDIHRILIQGGIFLYPNTHKHPQGKLRLVYECNPLSFIVEQAGGKAMTCQLERVLDLPVKHLHQRITIAIGSAGMVDEMKAFVERYSAAPAFRKKGGGEGALLVHPSHAAADEQIGQGGNQRGDHRNDEKVEIPTWHVGAFHPFDDERDDENKKHDRPDDQA